MPIQRLRFVTKPVTDNPAPPVFQTDCGAPWGTGITLAASVTGKGLAAYFRRELRDLDDAREKLGLCARLPSAW